MTITPNMPAAQTPPPTKGAAWAAETFPRLGRLPFDIRARKRIAAPEGARRTALPLAVDSARQLPDVDFSPAVRERILSPISASANAAGDGAALFNRVLATARRRLRNPSRQNAHSRAPFVGLIQVRANVRARAGARGFSQSACGARDADQRDDQVIHVCPSSAATIRRAQSGTIQTNQLTLRSGT